MTGGGTSSAEASDLSFSKMSFDDIVNKMIEMEVKNAPDPRAIAEKERRFALQAQANAELLASKRARMQEEEQINELEMRENSERIANDKAKCAQINARIEIIIDKMRQRNAKSNF